MFVKTPGLSPLKTRLARGLGRESADTFYRLSVAAVEAVVRAAADATGAVPYWAVAEPAGLLHPLWSRFERIGQGPGELGTRLSWVYEELRERHRGVVCLGADSPQITPQRLATALSILHADKGRPRFVLGRSHDGGFYLIGGTTRIPPAVWQSVPYSTDRAADELARRLIDRGELHELPPLVDVDVFTDLDRLAGELREILSPLPEQSTVLDWITALPADDMRR